MKFILRKTYQISDVINASTFDALTKASLGRVYQHTRGQGFGIISVDRSDRHPDKQENARLNNIERKNLKSDLKRMGYGYHKLTGHWTETHPDGTKKHVAERSYFVPKLKEKHAKELMHKYNQEAVVHSGPEHGGKVHVHNKDGSKVNIGRFSPKKIATAYSSVKGKNFTFKGFEYPVQNWYEAMEAESLCKSTTPLILKSYHLD